MSLPVIVYSLAEQDLQETAKPATPPSLLQTTPFTQIHLNRCTDLRLDKHITKGIFNTVSARKRNSPGRNSPCPCGSGIKYKRCCLQDKPCITIRKDVQDHLSDVLFLNRNAIEVSIQKAQALVSHSLSNDVTSKAIRDRQSNDEAKSLKTQAEIVQRCIELATSLALDHLNRSPHSLIYWFLLCRRVAPTLLLRVIPYDIPILNNQRQSISSGIIEILNVLTEFVLDSSLPQLDIDEKLNSGVRGTDFSAVGKSEMETLGYLVGYAIETQQYRTAFRNVNKGIPLRDLTQVGAPEDNGVLYYEQRRDEYGTISGFAGVWYDPISLPTRNQWKTEWASLRINIHTGYRIRVERDDRSIESLWILEEFLEKRQIPNITSLASIPSHVLSHDERTAFTGLPLKSLLQAFPDRLFLDFTKSEISDFLTAIYLVIRTHLSTRTVAPSKVSRETEWTISQPNGISLRGYPRSVCPANVLAS